MPEIGLYHIALKNHSKLRLTDALIVTCDITPFSAPERTCPDISTSCRFAVLVGLLKDNGSACEAFASSKGLSAGYSLSKITSISVA